MKAQRDGGHHLVQARYRTDGASEALNSRWAALSISWSNVIIVQTFSPISFCAPISPVRSLVHLTEEVDEKKPPCDFKDC